MLRSLLYALLQGIGDVCRLFDFCQHNKPHKSHCRTAEGRDEENAFPAPDGNYGRGEQINQYCCDRTAETCPNTALVEVVLIHCRFHYLYHWRPHERLGKSVYTPDKAHRHGTPDKRNE